MQKHSYGIWAAVFSSILSSISIIVQSEAISYLGPMVVCVAASLLGSFFLIAYLSWNCNLPTLAEVKGSAKGLVLLTLLRCVFGAVLFVMALSYTSSIKAMFFTKAEPYFVLFWGRIIKGTKIANKHIGLLAIHIVAAILLSTGGNLSFQRAQLGDFLILLSMACSSLSYLVGSTLSISLGAKSTNALTQLAGGLLLLPLAVYFAPNAPRLYEWEGWGYIALQVLLFNLLALTLWYFAIKSVEAWIVSALRAIGPLIAAPLAWLFFREILSPIQIVGGMLVLVTSALIAREHMVSSARISR